MTVALKRSAPDIVREGLRRAILSGEIAGGTQLRQDELAERFGTSRIPVREALRQLEAEGLVTIHVNRGAVVSSLSIEEVLELLDIRIALECRALALAIPEMVESDFEAAEAILQTYDHEPDPARWPDMNWAFHESLYAPCNRPRLLSMIRANYGHISRFLRVQVSKATGKAEPQEDHRRLIQECRNKTISSATKLLETHISKTQKIVRSSLRKSFR